MDASTDEEGVREPLLKREETFEAATSRTRENESDSGHRADQAQQARPAPVGEEEAHITLEIAREYYDEAALQGMPEASLQWREQRALMLAWLLSSLVTLLLSSLSPLLGTTSALAGITGSSWFFSHCCGIKQAKDIASNIQVVRKLALAAGCLSGLYTFLLVIVGLGACTGEEEYREYCGVLRVMFLILTAWHFLHATVSLRVAYKARRIEPLLNPFSSGVLS